MRLARIVVRGLLRRLVETGPARPLPVRLGGVALVPGVHPVGKPPTV